MGIRKFNLAIETSGPVGSVTIGQGDEMMDTVEFSGKQRHNIELVSALQRLMSGANAEPVDLDEVYVSIGPGSFTGLRVAVSTVKMLALVAGIRIVAVPSIEVVAARVAESLEDSGHLAVCLNRKTNQAYSGVFCRCGQVLELLDEPHWRSFCDLLEQAPRPLAIVGHELDDVPECRASQVTILPGEIAVGRSADVWRLGRLMANRGLFEDPGRLVPLYARDPEAVVLWDQRHGSNE